MSKHNVIELTGNTHFGDFMNWDQRKIVGVVYNCPFFISHYVAAFLQRFEFFISLMIDQPHGLKLIVNNVNTYKNRIIITNSYPGKFPSSLQQSINDLFTHPKQGKTKK
jgi:hypothetical protein